MSSGLKQTIGSVLFAMLIGLPACVSSDFDGQAGSGLTANMSISTNSTSAEAVRSGPQIFMFSGGFNGIFSTGVKKMAVKLSKQGIRATALSWTAYSSSLSAITKTYRGSDRPGPIILAGHSLGGSTAMRLATELSARDIPVELVVLFDSFGVAPVPKSVRKLINYKVPSEDNKTTNFKLAPGAKGKVVNISIKNLKTVESGSHWTIVNQAGLQDRAVREIASAAKIRRR